MPISGEKNLWTSISGQKDFLLHTSEQNNHFLAISVLKLLLSALHCLLYGRYGITPTILFADDVLQAYAMIKSSIMLLLQSLRKKKIKNRFKITI